MSAIGLLSAEVDAAHRAETSAQLAYYGAVTDYENAMQTLERARDRLRRAKDALAFVRSLEAAE